jgi:micrococcal nuclease
MCCGNKISQKTLLLIFTFLIFFSLINQFLNQPNQKNSSYSKNLSQSKTTIPTKIASTEAFLVTKVIDGDTVVLENGEKVRYLGIDTPELHHPKKEVECFAYQAYEKNKELVLGKKVFLQKDISEKDKYGRLLRYVFLDEKMSTNEESFVNLYLVKNGFAYATTFPPDVKYVNLFLTAQKEAYQKNLGLWQKCQNQNYFLNF